MSDTGLSPRPHRSVCWKEARVIWDKQQGGLGSQKLCSLVRLCKQWLFLFYFVWSCSIISSAYGPIKAITCACSALFSTHIGSWMPYSHIGSWMLYSHIGSWMPYSHIGSWMPYSHIGSWMSYSHIGSWMPSAFRIFVFAVVAQE